MIHNDKKEVKLAVSIPHVTTRNGTFQYQRRVPDRIIQDPAVFAALFGSKALYRKSLRTKDLRSMHSAYAQAHADFEQRLAIAGQSKSASSSTSTPAPLLKVLSQAELDELTSMYRQITVRPFERAHTLADAGGDGAEFDRLVGQLEEDAADIRAALASRGPGVRNVESPREVAAWVIEKRGLNAPVGSDEFAAVVAAIRLGMAQGWDDVDALVNGRSAPKLSSMKGVKVSTVPTLREAVHAYLDHMDLPPRTETEVKTALRTFEALIGNERLDALDRSSFLRFIEHLAAQKIGGKTPGSVQRPASRATVKKGLGLLRAVINHTIQRGKFAGPNPAAGIDVTAYVVRSDKAVMPAKRRFSEDEMNLVFQHPWFSGCISKKQDQKPGSYRLKGSEYWVPVVASLTGCRASELGGLMLAEVMIEDTYPHLLIRDNHYRRTKTGHQREVPIIDQLMELGFADYVKRIRKSGADRLFPDWQSPKAEDSSRNDDKAWSNARIIRSFNRTVIKNMLGDRLLKGARQEVTFHSFRGAFKAMLSGAEYKLHPNYVNEVIGHAKLPLDGAYIGNIPLEDLYPAIRKCRFKNLRIPMPSL